MSRVRVFLSRAALLLFLGGLLFCPTSLGAWGMKEESGTPGGPHTPEQLDAAFLEAFNKGDLEGCLDCYEPGAAFLPEPGAPIISDRATLSAVLKSLLDHKKPMVLKTTSVVSMGTIVLLREEWTMPGVVDTPKLSTLVARQQQDGTWRYVIETIEEAPTTPPKVEPAAGAAQAGSKELNVLMLDAIAEWCEALKQGFESRYGITVNYVRLPSAETVSRVRAEKEDPQFDVWWGAGPEVYIAAKEEGLLSPYESPNFRNLLEPSKVKDPDNYWVAMHLYPVAFCTNTNWLAAHPGVQAPQSWDDLLRPEFKGQVAVAHPAKHDFSYRALATILQLRGQEEGWKYEKAFAGQMLRFCKSATDMMTLVGQGEAAVGIQNYHYLVDAIVNGAQPLVVTFPRDGTGYWIRGMAILKGAKHLDAARKWVDWACTPEAQAIALKAKVYTAATVRGVELPYPELSQVKLMSYDSVWAANNKKDVLEKFSREIADANALK